jgi:hypothetical protein
LLRHPPIIAPIGVQRQALLTERLRLVLPIVDSSNTNSPVSTKPGQLHFYFGDDQDKFSEVFSSFGSVLPSSLTVALRFLPLLIMENPQLAKLLG